jgi:hypothetical protein
MKKETGASMTESGLKEAIETVRFYEWNLNRLDEPDRKEFINRI